MLVHNINLHVEVKGEGDAVLLLHGWGQNAYMMKFIQDHLSERFCVVNLDLPGFGKSEEPHEVWTTQEYANCVHDVMMALHLQNPIIIAHSFGARIAFRYALCYPVKKMVLTGAAGLRPKRSWTYYARVYTYKLMKKLHRPLAMGSEDYQKASVIMRGVLVSSVNEDIHDDLKDILCETLLVWGEKDEQTPLWMGKVMEQEMPNATLVVLKKEDHFAYFHQSLRFCRILDAFLEVVI